MDEHARLIEILREYAAPNIELGWPGHSRLDADAEEVAAFILEHGAMVPDEAEQIRYAEWKRQQALDPITLLIDQLRHEQHTRCAYGTREGDGRTCDCKYGLGAVYSMSRGEATGCPELRTAIRTLQAVWMRCWCGGQVGQRVPGDRNGLGCLKDIHHVWLSTLDNLVIEEG